MSSEIALLKRMLEKAYRIEASFEDEANFKAFIATMDEEQRKTLFKLMTDSERHKLILEELAKELGFELEKVFEKFEFSDRRLFNEIYKIEMSAKAIYEQIVRDFGKTLGEKSEVLEKIAKEEEMHAKLVEKFVDKTLRII